MHICPRTYLEKEWSEEKIASKRYSLPQFIASASGLDICGLNTQYQSPCRYLWHSAPTHFRLQSIKVERNNKVVSHIHKWFSENKSPAIGSHCSCSVSRRFSHKMVIKYFYGRQTSSLYIRKGYCDSKFVTRVSILKHECRLIQSNCIGKQFQHD